jgi:hypothetical protein
MTRAIELATRILGAVAFASLASPVLAGRSEVAVDDTLVYPESISALQDGTLILGSSSKPVIYRAGRADTKAEAWIHLTGGDNLTTLGVLADPRSKTLWACVIQPANGPASAPAPRSQQPPPSQRVSALRAFDLSSGAPKSSYPLPGANNVCNDIAIARDGTLYISDTPNGRVLRRLFVAENRAGRVSELTLKADEATVTVIKDGYMTPTAVSPIGDTLWVGEAKFAYRNDPKLQGQDPGPFKAYALPLPH